MTPGKLSLFPQRRFRTRSDARDAATDQARLNRLTREIDLALASVDRETSGLTRRLDLATASYLAQYDQADVFETRRPEDEQDLRASEREMVAARERLATLSRHRAALERALHEIVLAARSPTDAPAIDARAGASA